tara:strand:+ start:8589 stop:9680 length:1092 start_codon:yes stop_codon:yes gene_type:complete
MSSVANYNIEDNSGANVRIDLNAVFAAIQSNNSETSDLATSKCVAGMTFLNSTSNELKIRNSSNGAFTTIGNIDQPNLGLLSKAGGTMTGQFLADDSNSASAPAISFDTDTDLGLFRKSANIMGFSSAGTEQMVFDANGITLRQQNEIRFGDNDSSNYVAFKSHATVGTSYTLTLPSGQGANGTVLQNDGSGNLSFQPGTVVVGNTTINVGAGAAASITGLTALTATTLNATEVKVTNYRDASGGNTFTASEMASLAGSKPVKAFVNFNGTGTVAIRAGFNVSSITDNETGGYQVNFTSNLSSSNYSVTHISSQNNSGHNSHGVTYILTAAISASSFKTRTFKPNSSAATIDKSTMCFTVFES